MWQATANYRDLWLQLPSRIERHAKLRSFHIRRTWCSLQRLSDLLNADFLLCLWIDSNASFPRLTAASTRFGSAVQTKGFGVELVSARKRLIATWRSTRERKTPRLRRRLVSLAKEPFHGVEPGRRGWGEVERPAGMSRKPSARYYGANATRGP